MKVQQSNRDKVLFGDSGITKGAMIDYYRKIAPHLLRHVRRRALSFKRCPDGIADCFFQKDRPDYFPDEIDCQVVEAQARTLCQVTVEHPSHLIYLANQACVEWHMPLATTDRPHRPDQVVFDLDPGSESDFDTVKRAARTLRSTLARRDLSSLLKTTGSKGLHVVVPIRPEHEYDNVRAWARQLTEALARRESDWLTTAARKNKRGGRLYLDIGRNAFGQTAVAPYSVRALSGAPVATPLDWDELTRLDGPGQYTITNLPRRLGQRQDPWLHFASRRQKLVLE